MAYREPCSSIFLFKGCPCDRSYNNTIYFEDRTAQWVYFRDHYFSNSRSKSYTNQYYQRYAKGTLRIQERADNLYEFNYMAFCNDNGFNPLVGPTGAMKVFYCFIDSIEYINEHTTEVAYTIDVIQSYMFNYRLGMCFVEREHTIRDEYGENLIDEKFEGNDYNYRLLYQFRPGNESLHNPAWYIAVKYVPNTAFINFWEYKHQNDNEVKYYTRTTQNALGKGEIRNGVYTGAKTLYIPIFKGYSGYDPTDNNIYNVETAINELVNLSAVITSMSLLPKQLVNLTLDLQFPLSYDDVYDYSYETDIVVGSNLLTFRGSRGETYTAKNKKLAQSPYRDIIAYDNNGNYITYNWEDFNENFGTGIFKIYGSVNGETEIILVPTKYKGLTENTVDVLRIQNFPSIAWSEDSFARFWSENQNKITSGIVAAAVSSIYGSIKGATSGFMHGGKVGAIAGGIMGGVSGLASGASSATNTTSPKINQQGLFPNNAPKTTFSIDDKAALRTANAGMIGVASIIDVTRKRDSFLGQQSVSQNNILMDKFGITIWERSIKPYYAKQIDAYFNLYGYKVSELKVPNIFAVSANDLRPCWNYIKNVETVVLPITSGNTANYVDADVEEELQSIYNKGITFWMNGEEVGDYSINNSPNVI